MIQATLEDAKKGAKLYYKSRYADEYIEVTVKVVRETWDFYVCSTKGVHYKLDELTTK